MILLDGSSLTLDDLDRIAHGREPMGLTPAAAARVAAARAVVDRHAAGSQPVYGINTGFGALANAGVHPRVPARGSVGASGDLAPLAHLALVLVGEGEAETTSGVISSG